MSEGSTSASRFMPNEDSMLAQNYLTPLLPPDLEER